MHFPKNHKGTIALDIDGTITNLKGHLEEDIHSYLLNLATSGWDLIFLTGREFVYAMQAIGGFNFPYFLAVQNGADLIAMPSRKKLKNFYFQLHVVKDFEEIVNKSSEDFLLYAGFEKGDFCFYRPMRFSNEVLELLTLMRRRGGAPWVAVEHFHHLGQEAFSMIKMIGSETAFAEIENEILKKHSLQISVIKDPTSRRFDLLLLTHVQANKGNALQYFLDHYSMKRPLIVAGDDHNDESSLQLADIRIVMGNASPHLKSLADVIAPNSYEKGIIQGLEDAMKRLL